MTGITSIGNVSKLYQNTHKLSSGQGSDDSFKQILSLFQEGADHLRKNESASMNFASGKGGDMGEAAIDTAIAAVSVEGIKAFSEKLINVYNEITKMSI